jgi:hypothetical protein
MDLSEIEVRETVEVGRLAQLMELFAAEWWTASRTADDVAAMLAASGPVLALTHRPTDRLVGFARVITDDAAAAPSG